MRLGFLTKGAMSEAELHVLKQRLLAGQQAKAKRGKLRLRVPMGYVRRSSGEVVKAPDEQAQAVIALIFEQFARLGTIAGVLRYLVRQGIQLPGRVAAGLNKGDLVWRRPHQSTLKHLLHHPMYAGAYVYGRRPTEARRKHPGRPATGRRVAPPTAWQVLLKDHYPAYITWAQFERNQRQLGPTAMPSRAPSGGGPRCSRVSSGVDAAGYA
jgi:hypothetical protein